MSGTVAAGAALRSVTLNIVDATGKSIQKNVAVPASGSFTSLALTGGTGPFRLAACGYLADRYSCLYSVTQNGGTANITPLTSAAVLLATGALPTSPLAGAASGPSATAVAAAQSQLQTALAPALADAGLAANADLFTTAFSAGSRAGMDRLLDGLNVTLGQDGATPFVQIDARLGSGGVALNPSGSSGQITIDPGAGGVTLAGIDTLFTAMTAAMASASACDSGMGAVVAPNARLTISNLTFTGADVAAGICNTIGTGLFSDGSIPYGSKLLSPQLGHCDFTGTSGSSPVCRVSLIVQTPKGALMPLALNQAVAWQGGGSWLLLGDMQPFPASADARAQRLRRVDGGQQVDSYLRGIGVGISTLSGALCARVSQKDGSGADQTLAFYKPGSGAANLSVWNVDAVNNQVSLDPSTGAIRGNDDRWIPLPDGATGDAIVRNFYAGGQQLTVALYGDDACTAPLTPTGGSSVFTLDLPAAPPLSAQLAGLPWPSLVAASVTALGALKGNAAAKVSYSTSWTLPSPPPALSAALLCVDSLCQPTSTIANLPLAPSATSGALSATIGSAGLAAGDFKQLRLNARNGDGLLLTADFQSCPSAGAGSACAVSMPLRQAARAVLRPRSR